MPMTDALRELLVRIDPRAEARRPVDVQPDDILLASYPRSGNTWVRTIIARVLFPNAGLNSLSDLDGIVPDMHREVPARRAGSAPRVIKTHAPFAARPLPGTSRDNRAIYIVRHPYDVTRSYYDYLSAVDPSKVEAAFPVFVSRLLRGAVWPCSWQEHVHSWLAGGEDRARLVVRYEDLVADPVPQVRALAEFCGAPLTSAEADVVARACSRERMVEMERRGSLVREDYDFVRRTDAERPMEHVLTAEIRAEIDAFCGHALEAAGYRSSED